MLSIGSLNLQMHSKTDFHVKLRKVYVTEGIGFKLVSLHDAQARQTNTLDKGGAHRFDGRLTFSRDSTGSSLFATGIYPTPSKILTDVSSMSGASPPSLSLRLVCPAAAQALSETDWHELHVGNVGITAAVALAPGRRPFGVGKSIDINHFHVSSGYLNQRLLRETALQHVVTWTGLLQPFGGCLKAKGVEAGVPHRTTSRAGKPMETAHIDLAGPYEASVAGPSTSLCSTTAPRGRCGRTRREISHGPSRTCGSSSPT